MRYLGDNYVKDEFKLHKNAAKEFVPAFTKAWTDYRDSLEAQFNSKNFRGQVINDSKLDDFSKEQMGQLLELKKSAKELNKLKK
jgi:Ran GTPase-activating protein (RanGAP) involved in mRNA processing and transport